MAIAEVRGLEAVIMDPILVRQEDRLNKEEDILVRGQGVILDQDILDREAILVQVLDILDKQGVLKVAILDKQGVPKVAILDIQELPRDLEDILDQVLDILDRLEVPKVATLDQVLLVLLGPGVTDMEDTLHSRVRVRDTRAQLQCSLTVICPLALGPEVSCARG